MGRKAKYGDSFMLNILISIKRSAMQQKKLITLVNMTAIGITDLGKYTFLISRALSTKETVEFDKELVKKVQGNNPHKRKSG